MRNLSGEPPPRNLAGSLLIAHPNMLDPNFRRAVLFISAHDPEEGALGVIINRPLDKQVSDLVSEVPPAGLAEVPVFLVGYAGWGAGQLEAEMKQKAWLLQKPGRFLLEADRRSTLWFDIMRGLGPWYKMLAAAPDDPSLN